MSLLQACGAFVESSRAQRFITWLIVLNAVVLGLDTVPWVTARYGGVLDALDTAILVVFVIELATKLACHRLAFFRNGWNWFDLVVVGIALVPAAGPLAVLRTLRVLRLLRLLSVVPSMRSVVEGLFRALPGMGSIAALIGLIFYVAAVLATKLYGASFPEWFGNLGASLYSLFQIMTLESWSMGIVRPVMEVHGLAWLFFVPFILVTTFAVLNLFIGTIVSAMQSESQEEQSKDSANARTERAAMMAELGAMSAKLTHLNEEIASLRKGLELRAAAPDRV
ncbi:MAG: ion transporter [Enhydrobacter sp.]|nr:MAG: ion transporter [Enhydrobacter sp.]